MTSDSANKANSAVLGDISTATQKGDQKDCNDGELSHGRGEDVARRHPEPPPSMPPKEDLFAWLQVLGAFFLNFNTWGMMNAYGAFQTYYQLHLLRGQPSSHIAWIGSVQASLLFFVSLLVGPLFDAGYLPSLLWVGGALLVLGMFLLSITSQYWQVFLTQALMMGLGFGCLYLPAPAVVSQYFHASTALAMGASSSGSAIGGVVFPIVFSRLESDLGFRWATRILGFILLVTSIAPAMLMESRAPPQRPRTLYDPDALRDLPYLFLNLGLFFGFMGLYVAFYYIELFALDRTDVSRDLSRYILVIINLSSLPGRLIPGYYADKMGSVTMQTMVALTSAVLTFCLMAIRTTPALVVFSVLYGFFAGAFMGLPAASIINLTENGGMIGTRIGMTLATVGVGVLVSNPIAGAILGEDRNWTGLIGWCGALVMASSVAMAASRISKVGPSLAKVI